MQGDAHYDDSLRAAHSMSSSRTYPARRSPAQLSRDYPLLYELSINLGPEILLAYTKLGRQDRATTSHTLRDRTSKGQMHFPYRPGGDMAFPRLGQSSYFTTNTAPVQTRRALASREILSQLSVARKRTTNDQHPKHNPCLTGLPRAVY